MKKRYKRLEKTLSELRSRGVNKRSRHELVTKAYWFIGYLRASPLVLEQNLYSDENSNLSGGELARVLDSKIDPIKYRKGYKNPFDPI